MIENPSQDIKYIDSIVINSEFLLEKLTQSHTCWSWCGNCNYVVHKKSDISHILLFWSVSRDTRLVKQWESVRESGHCRKTVVRYCWNSLIVHQVKTKKTTSVKEVWIRGLNYSLVFVLIEKNDISNTQDSVSSAIQAPQISSKILCCTSYSTLFSVFSYPDETLSLVFDIILKKPLQQKEKPFWSR